MIATIANTNTAAALVSFATFASGWYSSVTKSTTASIAVLINSHDITNPIVKTRIAHSYLLTLNKNRHFPQLIDDFLF